MHKEKEREKEQVRERSSVVLKQRLRPTECSEWTFRYLSVQDRSIIAVVSLPIQFSEI